MLVYQPLVENYKAANVLKKENHKRKRTKETNLKSNMLVSWKMNY